MRVIDAITNAQTRPLPKEKASALPKEGGDKTE